MDEAAQNADQRVGELVKMSAAYEGSSGTIARRIEVTVWDSAPVLPVARAADPGRVGQHGMEIVMAVCQSFEVHREPVGKRMTAAVMLADDPGGGLPDTALTPPGDGTQRRAGPTSPCGSSTPTLPPQDLR